MKLVALFLLCLSSAALSPARAADADPLNGEWRGTITSPSGESVIELRFDQSAGIYRGRYRGANASDTSFPIDGQLASGQAIRFVVPNVGIFEGRLHGNVLEGTFTGVEGAGPFHLDRGPEPDFREMMTNY